jgi:hypothetical protein
MGLISGTVVAASATDAGSPTGCASVAVLTAATTGVHLLIPRATPRVPPQTTSPVLRHCLVLLFMLPGPRAGAACLGLDQGYLRCWLPYGYK